MEQNRQSRNKERNISFPTGAEETGTHEEWKWTFILHHM
jgi:hypothetical protein